MRTLIRWAARLYPARWRDRYAAEFDALLDDMSPSLKDLSDVLAGVLRVRAASSIGACLVWATASQSPVRLPVVFSIAAQALIISLVVLASWGHVAPMPSHLSAAPLPPPIPDAPPQVTDARVFPYGSTLYSSLPFATSAQGRAVTGYVVDGVGINFLTLPDIGATYRQGHAEWRVWPGQALEAFILRRVLPEYPRGTNTRGAVSIFVEYVINLDGSVKVLRTSGPAPFTGAAQSAIERWRYRPLEFEHRPCEVVTRLEVRFNSEFARSAISR